MSKKGTSGALIGLILGVACIFIGLAALGASLMLNDGDASMALTYAIIMYVGIAVAALGVLVTVISVIVGMSGRKKTSGDSQKKADAAAESIPEVNMNLDGSATYYVAPASPSATEKYEFVTVGKRQSLEEKFEQIGKMGKTQFVIYVAKLFSLKGFEVQLTPVIENNGIDMLVKKEGVTRAVGCLLSAKVLCAEDIVSVDEGKKAYNVKESMVITNMFFDRTSLDFAKSHSMVLVDRNILSEQYMN